MTIDASTYCPGGTGKKIKHCACRDISGELEKIMRALSGNQRVAALNQINRVLATKANRPCLLALKILTLMDMEEKQSLEETVTTFVQVAPDNPLAHAFAALLEVSKGHTKTAVDCLQMAIYSAQDVFPGELYDAVGAVAQALANDHKYVAARGHLLFRAMIGGQDQDAVQPLMAISSAGDIPTLLKRDLIFADRPGDVSWQATFDAAAQLCARGAWKAALEAFEKLNDEFPGQACIVKNIAVAHSYLGDTKTGPAWHTYANLKSIDFDEAVVAEATSQLLDYETCRKTIGLVKITFNVTDANVLQEKMLSSPRIVTSPVDPAQIRQEGSPPPKAVFQLLDRPLPPSDAELTLEILPCVLGQALLHGKQTDCEARLEVILTKGARFESSLQMITEIAGDLLVAEGENEEVLDAVPTDTVELFPSLRFPNDAGFSARKRLTGEAVSAAFQETWPLLPLTALDDKTPREAAQDPPYRRRLAAALLALEQVAEVESWPVDVDRLREQLGVPIPATIDPTAPQGAAAQPHQWHLIDAAKLTDDLLQSFYQRASIFSARTAIHRLGTEVLQRNTMGERLDLASVAGGLAKLSNAPEEALKLLSRAREFAEKAGTSPARWYLEELPFRLLGGDTSEVQHIMTLLQTRHIREPGIAESLYNILVRFGIIPPDGQPSAGGPQPAAPPTAAAEPEQGVWTPEAAQAPAGEKKESKLWIPGMD